MAETKLTMSLDDLIAQASRKRDRKPAAPKQSGGPGPQSGPRKGLKKNRQKNAANGSGSGQQPRPKQQPQQQQQQQQQPQRQSQGQGGQRNRKGGAANLGVRGGQVQKRSVIEVPVKAIRSPPQAPPPQLRRQQQPRQPAPEGKWQHDLYQDDYGPARRAAPVAQAAVTNAKLIITNLHHQVSEDDLLELFSTCGTVKGRSINYDISGRSLGTGWILFETRAEAEKAKREYHGVKLDGQPMEISFSSDLSSGPSMLTKLSSGISVQKPGAGGAGARAGGAGKAAGNGGQRLAAAAIRETAAASRGGRGGARNNRLRSTVVGRAELDAQLQDYMQE